MILLAVTPGEGWHRARWQAVLRSGIDGFLIREHTLSARTLLDAARWCQDTAPEVTLWVAGRLDVACAAGCGLHAPEAHPEVGPGLVPRSRPSSRRRRCTSSRRRARGALIIRRPG